MKKYLFPIIFLVGNIWHISFLHLNEVMKIADSFAYLQMAHHFWNLSSAWFGNGWFGFLYSLPIAVFDVFINNEMIASFALNILLFNLLAGFCYSLWKNYLSLKYNILFLILIFLSPILLNYNIHILSENIYIPLFLILFLWILRYKDIPNFSGSVFLWLILALLYYTRSEAFIYLGSVGVILFWLLIAKKISFLKFLWNGVTIVVAFGIFIAPYIFYLHSFTGEWWLTNKWSANLRQAELRGVSKMDDDGFEQAVWELTSDNRHLIAGFAGWLKYDKPQIENNFKNYLLEKPTKVLQRIQENQIKLYTQNLPHLIVWNASKLYEIEWSKIFYKNPVFFILLILPILFCIYWVIALMRNGEWYFVWVFLSFFIVGSLFFTLFFVLDRYFVIFVPIFIFFIVYGVEKAGSNLKNYVEHTKYIFASLLLVGMYSLWILSYYNTFKNEDAKYEVKKIAGEWLRENDFRTNLRVMERFPIVTYYSWSWERWLTPYTSKLENLVEYAKYHDVHYLVVDSIDFYRYREDLRFLFDESEKKYSGLEKVQEFEKNGERVILYRVK